jgi:hypothetical protein
MFKFPDNTTQKQFSQEFLKYTNFLQSDIFKDLWALVVLDILKHSVPLEGSMFDPKSDCGMLMIDFGDGVYKDYEKWKIKSEMQNIVYLLEEAFDDEPEDPEEKSEKQRLESDYAKLKTKLAALNKKGKPQ